MQRRGYLLSLVLLSSVFAIACGGSPGSVHTAADYPEDPVQASRLELVVLDERSDSMFNDGLNHHPPPASFKAAAEARLRKITGPSGPALKVVARIAQAHSGEVESKKGPMLRVEVELEFQVLAEDGTVIRRGTGASWGAVTEDKADDFDEVLRATWLNAFDQYWASEETITKLNADLETYTQYKERWGSPKKTGDDAGSSK
jgi:hypothetical protein